MGALPRPDLPPGPQRDLNDALHELHHRAGWPSLRTMASHAGCSHTTVSGVFSAPRIPSWGILELLVEAMNGDVEQFHHLWLDSASPAEAPSRAGAGIAGRRTELAAVRRHLEAGSGLLLVTGEAGIGKTKLVTTAAAVDRFVATTGRREGAGARPKQRPATRSERALPGLSRCGALSPASSPALRQDPDTRSDHKRNSANDDRCECSAFPALHSCTSPTLQSEREAESTEDDRGAEPEGQHSHQAEDGADKANLRGAVTRGVCAPSPASEKGEERDREDNDQGDEDDALAIVRPELPDRSIFVLDSFKVRKEDGRHRCNCSPRPKHCLLRLCVRLFHGFALQA